MLHIYSSLTPDFTIDIGKFSNNYGLTIFYSFISGFYLFIASPLILERSTIYPSTP